MLKIAYNIITYIFWPNSKYIKLRTAPSFFLGSSEIGCWLVSLDSGMAWLALAAGVA